MLSDKEKMEMLYDAGSAERRKMFRRARVKPNHPSYDAYLKFLSKVQNLFNNAESQLISKTKTNFKL